MNKTIEKMREFVSGNGLAHVMAAHSPLSARLAEEAGFDGIWASGFELSAMYGLPDISLVTMTQHLEMVRAMADQTSIPIIADIDTGFGNALNVLQVVPLYARAGAAAVVIEDKTFPKVTSLVEGGRQELLRVAEFQGKVEAACHARGDSGMVIVADGTDDAAGRLERVLWNDPASGVMRHADAGYEEAIACARELGLDLPMVDL